MKRLVMVPEGWPCTLAECMLGRSFVCGITPKQMRNLEQFRIVITDATIKGTRRMEAFNFIGKGIHNGRNSG